MLGGKVVVRCSQGHVFKTTWSPWGSLVPVRLAGARLQRCPVGVHWGLVRLVSEAEPSEEDRRLVDQDRG
jgi:hypothetical protein